MTSGPFDHVIIHGLFIQATPPLIFAIISIKVRLRETSV